VDIVLAGVVLGIELAISILIGLIPRKSVENLSCAISLALGVVFPIAYLSLEFRTALAIDGNMLIVAGVAFFLPQLGILGGIELKKRIRERRKKAKMAKWGKEWEESREQKREERIRQELEEYTRLGQTLKKMKSAPETLTTDERSLLRETVKEVEPIVGMTTIAVIGGLDSWDGEAPADITQEELDQIPDVVTVSYVCPNCREINKFEYRKLSTPLSKAPESMNIVGGRLFTTTSADCSKCNRTTTMTLLQCDKCKVGWQPFFRAVQTKTLLTGTCHNCFFGQTDSQS